MARISISNAERGLGIYLNSDAASHLGGISTRVVIHVKRIDDKVDMFLVTLRANMNGRNKITNQANSKKTPFRVFFTEVDGWLKRWPRTPVNKPVEVSYNSEQKAAIQFYITKQELQGFSDMQEKPPYPKSSLSEQVRTGMGKPAEPIKSFEELKAALQPEIDTVATAMASAYEKAGQYEDRSRRDFKAPEVKMLSQQDIEDRIQAQIEGKAKAPAYPDQAKAVQAARSVAIFQSATPHDDLNTALKSLNTALIPEVNDVELFIEEIDSLGNVTKTINLPPPGNIRIRGRIIREEILG